MKAALVASCFETAAPRPPQHEGDGFERATLSTPSLRAQRSNPESLRGDSLDCFVASLLAMTEWRRMGGVQFAFQIAGIRPHSRGLFCPSFVSTSHPLKQEGAGKTGCRLAPVAPVLNIAQAMHRGEPQVKPEHPAFPAQWVDGLWRALVSARSARMCERAVLTNRPSLDLSSSALKGLESLSGSERQIRCLPQPEQLHGL